MSLNQETMLNDNSFLVSETDSKGNIIYANDEFCNIAGYTLEELIGKPHNIVRSPDMPKAAFADLWNTVKKGQVWSGFVKNNTKLGGFYWVFATVYPFTNDSGEQCYLSCRRKPSRDDVQKYSDLYRTMH